MQVNQHRTIMKIVQREVKTEKKKKKLFWWENSVYSRRTEIRNHVLGICKINIGKAKAKTKEIIKWETAVGNMAVHRVDLLTYGL